MLVSLKEDCDLYKVSDATQVTNFECTRAGLTDFVLNESLLFAKELIAVTYFFALKSNPSDVVCFFTVSNDNIKVGNLPAARKKKFNKQINSALHQDAYPAVKIGRLAVHSTYAGKGVGKQMMDIIKGLFYFNNKTGCRFITVDSDISKKTLEYYSKNGFVSIFTSDEQEAQHFNVKLPLKTKFFIYDLANFND